MLFLYHINSIFGIIHFRPGSVVASYVARFLEDPQTPVESEDISRVVRSAAQNETFGNFTVDQDSIEHHGKFPKRRRRTYQQ